MNQNKLGSYEGAIELGSILKLFTYFVVKTKFFLRFLVY